MNIYELKESKKPSFFDKILNRIPKENALIEINNLFAKNENDLTRVGINTIDKIAEKYKLKLGRRFKKLRLELFDKYLYHSLKDHEIDEYELKVFNHLKEILYLNDTEIKKMISLETQSIYNQETKVAVSDGVLTEQEKCNLEILRNKLLIDNEIAESILKSNSEKIVSDFINDAISDERLSDEEFDTMNQIAANLGVSLKLTSSTKRNLDTYRLYWLIENGELPILYSSINIQKNEFLHFEASVNWMEQRRVTTRVNYTGVTARIKITKGVYYRMGSYAPKTISEDVWKVIDSGTIYLTNKRLIFMGAKGNKTIRINKVLDLNPYKNGIEIQKETGKSPFLEFNKNVDLFSMMLLRLMEEQ